ncbi:MAG: hypothetical protein EPN89_17990 [Methylovulum sp.]|nr:MAG: hypothetical protein EPN89_17990 [Methylovulum sp.]
MLKGLLAQLPIPEIIPVPPVPPQKTENQIKNDSIATLGDNRYCCDCDNLSNGRCKLNFRLVDTVLWCGFHPKNAELSRATGEGNESHPIKSVSPCPASRRSNQEPSSKASYHLVEILSHHVL